MITIIGAGIGGLSAGIRLAAAGHPVTIYEKNTAVGGKMGQIRQDGFRWDTGPSVITMRHVFEDLFSAAGKNLDDILDLKKVDPLTRYFYPDGTIIDACQNVDRMTAQLTALDPRDDQGYRDFLAYAAQIHQITGPVFIYDKPPTIKSFLRVPPTDWLKVDGLRTMNRAIQRHVHSPQLRQLLGRFATYVGASPYLAPATLNVIADVELSGGVWYPKGGIYQIAQEMARCAQELGVKIKSGCGVSEILTNNGRVQGLKLEDGSRIPTQAIISNLDVTTTFDQLLPNLPHTPPAEASCSGFIILLGVTRQHPQLSHHNIFFSKDYAAEFDAIFKDGTPAMDPTIYIAITSKEDPDHAPPGCENWFILVNAPPLNNHLLWENEKRPYFDHILKKLAERGVDIRPHIQVEKIITPVDLAKYSGAWRGALYGASANSRWAAFKRPSNRSRQVKGLYFAGGTTHPGGGVPMVTLSGKVAADMVMADVQSG